MKTSKNVNENVARAGQALVDDVVGLFVDLIVAGGTSAESVRESIKKSLNRISKASSTITYLEIGAIQRDCMEVMCAWRREPLFVDESGEPKALKKFAGKVSFRQLCKSAGCNRPWSEVLKVLRDFDAVTLTPEELVVSRTPTFLSRSLSGGRLAKDVVLRQLEGYLRVVHGNVCEISCDRRLRFERACSVTVAAELEPVFEELVRSRGQEFVDAVDEWLERNSRRKSAIGKYVELGAGAYFIDLGTRSSLGTRAL